MIADSRFSAERQIALRLDDAKRVASTPSPSVRLQVCARARGFRVVSTAERRRHLPAGIAHRRDDDRLEIAEMVSLVRAARLARLRPRARANRVARASATLTF